MLYKHLGTNFRYLYEFRLLKINTQNEFKKMYTMNWFGNNQIQVTNLPRADIFLSNPIKGFRYITL